MAPIQFEVKNQPILNKNYSRLSDIKYRFIHNYRGLAESTKNYNLLQFVFLICIKFECKYTYQSIIVKVTNLRVAASTAFTADPWEQVSKLLQKVKLNRLL